MGTRRLPGPCNNLRPAEHRAELVYDGGFYLARGDTTHRARPGAVFQHRLADVVAACPERIEMWPLAGLQPYAKVHGADQVAKIAASMAELQDLLADDYDLSLVGFSDGELDKLLAFDPDGGGEEEGGAGARCLR